MTQTPDIFGRECTCDTFGCDRIVRIEVDNDGTDEYRCTSTHQQHCDFHPESCRVTIFF